MSSNPFALLSEDYEKEQQEAKKRQEKEKAKKAAAAKTTQASKGTPSKKPELQPKALKAFGDYSKNKKKKKGSRPGSQNNGTPDRSPQLSTSSPKAKAQTESVKGQPSTSSPKPNQKAAAAATEGPTKDFPAKQEQFVSALNAVLGGGCAFFSLTLGPGEELTTLRDNPYKALGLVLRSPAFAKAFLQAIGSSAEAPNVGRVKVQKNLSRSEFSHHLLALLTGYSPLNKQKPSSEAYAIVEEFFQAMWNVSVVSRRDDDEGFNFEFGSGGNTRKDATLFDYLPSAGQTQAQKKKNRKKRQAANAGGKDKGKGIDTGDGDEVEEKTTNPVDLLKDLKKETPEAQKGDEVNPASVHVSKNGDAGDPLSWVKAKSELADMSAALSKRTSFGWKFLKLETDKLFVEKKSVDKSVKGKGKEVEVSSDSGRAFYFTESGCDHCYIWWKNAELCFLVTNSYV